MSRDGFNGKSKVVVTVGWEEYSQTGHLDEHDAKEDMDAHLKREILGALGNSGLREYFKQIKVEVK